MADENQATFTPDQVAELVRNAVSAAVSPLQAQIDSLKSAAPAQPAAAEQPKEYSRQQIDAAIEKGEISRTDGEAIWAQQTERRAARAAAEAATRQVSENRRAEQIASSIGEYADLVPKAFQDGTPERQSVRRQYDKLVEMGQPATTATELVALQILYGSAEALRAASSATRERVTTPEGGGGGSGGPRGGEPNIAKKLGLSERQTSHYQKLIDRGIYAGWSAVEDEMKKAGRAA